MHIIPVRYPPVRQHHTSLWRGGGGEGGGGGGGGGGIRGGIEKGHRKRVATGKGGKMMTYQKPQCSGLQNVAFSPLLAGRQGRQW